MATKPRFTLKAILGCTAALCVPLAIWAAGFQVLGAAILFAVATGCFAYLAEGWKGITETGTTLGIVLLVLLAWAAVVAIRLYFF